MAPYSVAVEANGFVYLAGQVAIDPAGGPTPEGVTAQTRLVMDNIGRILGDLGLGYDDIVKMTVFLKDMGDFAAMNAEYGTYFATEPPARTTIQAAALPKPEYRVEIETVAAR
jgi:2-iminobutanoate/2-iminopropanoate deaminase